MSTVEALNVKLDNLRLELQALQVENARLWEANPSKSAVIERENSKMEELQQSLHKARECKLQLQQEKESLSEELASVKQQLEEAKQALEAERTTREEGDNLLKETQAEITELRVINGKLQLELKCSNQQVELYEYRLSAERNKVERLQVQLHAAHIDEALLRSTVDGTVGSLIDTLIKPSTSKSSLPKSSEDAAE